MSAPEDVAEDLEAYVLPRRGVVREDLGYAVLVDGVDPTPARFAGRLRLPQDPHSEVAAIRGWFRARGKDAFTWKLGEHTMPSHLELRISEVS